MNKGDTYPCPPKDHRTGASLCGRGRGTRQTCFWILCCVSLSVFTAPPILSLGFFLRELSTFNSCHIKYEKT